MIRLIPVNYRGLAVVLALTMPAVADDDKVTSPDYESITTEDDDGNTRMTPGNVDREIIDQVLVLGE